MTHILAIIAFALAVFLYVTKLSSGVWTWELCMLLGFLLDEISSHEKWPW